MFIVLLVMVYPMIIWAIAQCTSHKGEGEKLLLNGELVGYKLIGQSFTKNDLFNSRPSAVNYQAGASGGSNKACDNPLYLEDVRFRINEFRDKNLSISMNNIPADLVTASGSGLDPHISVQAAMIQVPRIAKLRNLQEEELKKLVMEHIEKPFLGIFGTEKVNVVLLNIALLKRVQWSNNHK
jgi:K+-transporting ATPase ATPase C chain